MVTVLLVTSVPISENLISLLLTKKRKKETFFLKWKRGIKRLFWPKSPSKHKILENWKTLWQKERYDHYKICGVQFSVFVGFTLEVCYVLVIFLPLMSKSLTNCARFNRDDSRQHKNYCFFTHLKVLSNPQTLKIPI